MEPSPHPAKPENAVGDVSPARRERKGAVENTPSEAHRLIWQSRSCRESGNVEGISLRTGKWRGVGKRQARGLAGVRAARAGEMPGARRPPCRDGAPPLPSQGYLLLLPPLWGRAAGWGPARPAPPTRVSSPRRRARRAAASSRSRNFASLMETEPRASSLLPRPPRPN